MPSAARADAPTPEGTEWHLVSYAVDGKRSRVPWNVDATLRLEAGQAIGSAGCNGFSGPYEVDADALTFRGHIGTTDVGCAKAWMDVEAGYMAALPTTVRWAIDTGPVRDRDRGLLLYDAAGDIILRFEEPSNGLTRADIGALASLLDARQVEIDRLRQRLANVRIGALRDRMTELEARLERLEDAQASSQ